MRFDVDIYFGDDHVGTIYDVRADSEVELIEKLREEMDFGVDPIE